MQYPVISLKKTREKSLQKGHPWVFESALAKVPTGLQLGQTVTVLSDSGDFLGYAAFSPHSQIRLRLWSSHQSDVIDADFIQNRILKAVQHRQGLLTPQTNACRLVHSEADGLPGLIVDQFNTTAVFQILSAGMEHFRDSVIQALQALPGITTLIERSDAEVRALEGLKPRVAIVSGTLSQNQKVAILENGFQYELDPIEGHKTGFYLDQRDNRALIEKLSFNAKRVLNGFCYTGGFTLAALRGGAKEVLSIDSSEEAITQAKQNEDLNGPFAGQSNWMVGDMFSELRRLRDSRAMFDLIILDPPKFAPTRAHAEKAARAYKDINLLGFKLLSPGGRLVTFSCSSGISSDLFRKIIAGSAEDAHVDAFVENTLSAGVDHPIRLSFPEGEYLKGLVLQRI